MGSGVAVGGSGVDVPVGVRVGTGGENEAHAESPSAKRRVKNMVLVYFQDIPMIFLL